MYKQIRTYNIYHIICNNTKTLLLKNLSALGQCSKYSAQNRDRTFSYRSKIMYISIINMSGQNLFMFRHVISCLGCPMLFQVLLRGA